MERKKELEKSMAFGEWKSLFKYRENLVGIQSRTKLDGRV